MELNITVNKNGSGIGTISITSGGVFAHHHGRRN
jgi:hypothetical protein